MTAAPRIRRAHASMIVGSLLIATSFPVVASIAGTLGSPLLTLLRFTLAALCFLPLVLWRHRRGMIPTWRSLARYALLSAPLVSFFLAMFEALRTTSAVQAGAWSTLGPGFAALGSFALLRERIPRRRLAALSLGMLGALWVVFRGSLACVVQLDLAVGDAIFLAGVAALGLYTVLVRLLHRGEPTAVMTFWTLVTGSLWLLVLAGANPLEVRWGEVEPRVFAAIGYLALFTTLITFYLSQSAVPVIGPTRTMAYTYLNPALVALLSWTLGTGELTWRILPGIGLTLVAMVLLQREGLDEARPPGATSELPVGPLSYRERPA